MELNKIYQGNTLEVLKTFPDNFVDTIITSPPYWCYADGHEVLTNRGWKDVSKIKAGDKVLSVNPKNMELEWVKVTAVNKWAYKGEMIEFKNTHIDLLVTPNHKMFVYYKHIGNSVKLREEVGYFQSTKNKKGKFLIEAKDIKTGYITPKTGFKWKGKNPQYFILPPLETVYNKRNRYYPPMKIKIEDWLAFLGIWIAEGSVRGSKGGKKVSYSVSIKQKLPNANKIRELLKRLPFSFSELKDSRGILRFEISHKQLWAYLKKLGSSYTKYIPKEIKELSPRLLKVFLKWYLMGDGCIKNKGTPQEEVSCYTVSKKLKDDLQEIALKVGSNTSLQGKNKLVFLRRGAVKLKEAMKTISYNGMVYGIQVEKNHTICIRRNNKIVFSGNSLRDYGEAVNTVWGGDPECKHEFELKHVYREPSKTGVISEKAKKGQGYRNYKSGFCKKCGAWYGQLGLEPTLDLYLVHLWQIADELYRVLKPTGVMFWNHGDCYGNSAGRNDRVSKPKNRKGGIDFKITAVPDKSLALQNTRFILGLIDIDYRIMVEWRAMGKPEGELEEMLKHPRIQAILRNSIIWYKPNHMPSSVRDRFASAYEPVFMLTKNRKYWFDLDAVRIPYSESGKQRRKYPVGKFGGNPQNPMGKLSKGIKGGSEYTMLPEEPHPLGKNPGDMWAIPTQPFPEAHFATFPERLAEPMVKAGCPRWICKKCGKARERITEPTEEYRRKLEEGRGYYENYKKAGKKSNKSTISEYYTVGWTDCGCNAGWRPGVVLDPFMGSGTVAVVAKRLGRNWIGIEINPEYIEMAYRRIDKTVYQPELFT